MESQSTRFDLPGFSLPLNYVPGGAYEGAMFPNALDLNEIEGGSAG